MTERQTTVARAAASLPADYAPLLADIKARVQSARIKAGLAANRELLALYWDIGSLILSRQQQEGWGTKVIERLALDLQRAFPGRQGFSPRNLKYMRAFAEAWPETAMVQAPAAPLAKTKNSRPLIVPATLAQTAAAIVQRSVAQLPWGHHTVLLNKLSTSQDRLWYAAKAVEFGWSRDVLALQIDSGLLLRQGKSVTNFQKTLPPAQSDLAQQINQPSIGLILCRSKSRVIAEYALRDLSKPIGVSGYVTRLMASLPKAFKGVVPSVAELEKGLAGE